MIDYEKVMAMRKDGLRYSYTDRDVMLYACGIGMGADPMEENELAFVNEATATVRPLKVVPTFASVAAWGAEPGTSREMGLTGVVLDGERDITFHKPLPTAANITADVSILGVYDKGKDTGAVIRLRTVLKDSDGLALATLVSSYFAVADGGFGGPCGAQPKAHDVPSRSPDQVIDIPTRRDQALIYRLCGDRYALHSEPQFARRAGYAQPILHGMCTYGITCRAILQTYAGYEPVAIRRHAARFSAPVVPGDIVTLELWKDGNVISFQAKVKERGVTVIKNGISVLT
ncbi:3-alpha,7-alpha,12-alpha-trihydroxy-5-beta-cholest-24-enoyl-CoA hydratase [Bradyrhizobium brasilense]|uniref:MaoC/PaaZ C-terminal domain-containing protein n=1 Tax=Bradyrhizobium brasilense TaxID=1419277 RepID=UPI001456D8EE|nr:MaoC/PaaZ C-terminal domain-containing protein [Bradyrhizobium brasilense]NLS75271.1 3-alpha,7-alpha,12-alpha-trihydroxy-5-beta-cholest-24-enoyl-CoA hydratase [Bradyrhizobium brasilense]